MDIETRKEQIQVLADKIEKELIDDDDQIFFVMRNYLNQAVTKGISDDIANCFANYVRQTRSYPFEYRNDDFKRFVDAAYRWEAEQQAIKEINENE